MRFDTWLTMSGSTMDFNTITNPPTREADFGGRLSHPTGFSSYRDPEDRFLLRYPEGWIVKGGPPVQTRSNRLPLAAKVDVLPNADEPWDPVLAAVTGAGGLLVDEKRLPGPP